MTQCITTFKIDIGFFTGVIVENIKRIAILNHTQITHIPGGFWSATNLFQIRGEQENVGRAMRVINNYIANLTNQG